ncbi:MAG: hypothetical protein IIX48_09885 [Lachnospiraceae bacterium]|nr:hypothetical protein [Lachnospiraceae bacterium]
MNKRRKHQLERFLYTAAALLLVLAVVFLCALGIKAVSRNKNADKEEQTGEMAVEEPSGEKSMEETTDENDFEEENKATDTETAQLENDLETEPEDTETKESDAMETYILQAEEMVSRMTLEEKVYQLFIITPEALTDVDSVTAAGQTTEKALEQYPVGGLVYFAKNLVDAAQTRTMLSKTQEYALKTQEVPLFLCVDEEGGKVTRIANNPSFGVKNVGDMQDITDSQRAYEAGAYIGSYLKDLGFNFDFAPDADVLTNGGDDAIGARSFGDNPQLVASFAGAVSDGLHEYGIFSTFKHFPGHGAVKQDTHEGFAYSDKTYEQFMEAEWVPFQKAQGFGADAVMVGHISLPDVTGDETPASLSEKMITQILRNDLGYDGLIITDALNMGAIVQNYSSSEAAVYAVLAGVDLLLMPADFHEAVTGVIAAVEDGTIPKERIDEAVIRIVAAKLKWQDVSKELESTTAKTDISDKTDASNKIVAKTDKETDNKTEQISPIPMIDVSAYQGNIDWKKVAASGVRGAMIRLGFRGYGSAGSLNTDDYFWQNLQNAKNAGLKVGVYFHSEAVDVNEAKEEARFVIDKLQNADLSLPVAYDLEYSNQREKRSNFLNTAQRTDLAIAFCNEIQSAGYDAMVYYDVEADSQKTIDTSRLSNIKIWVADYQSKDTPAYRGTYQMWQYSNTGSVSGISGNVDLDYFVE